MTSMNKRRLKGVALIAALTLNGAMLPGLTSMAPAMAHEGECPYCQMSLTQDTATQDNEVALKYGRKRIEYKCVYCAFAEAKSEFPKGDLTINAPSEKKGKPVIIKRTGGKWSALPATAAFVGADKAKHRVCQTQYRAFTSKAAAQAYATKNGGKVMTLGQMAALPK